MSNGMKKYHVQICTDIASNQTYEAKYTSFNIKAYNKDQILDQFSHYFITEVDEVTDVT